jgi:uncharacterized membrane protein YgcG
MPERERHSPDLISEEGTRALQERRSVADLVDEHLWLATWVVSAGPGAAALAALALTGTAIGWALLAGGAVTITFVAAFAAASAITGRPVLPEIFTTINEPPERLEGHLWPTRAQAEREARTRNLRERTCYWIEIEVSPGSWAIERRRFRGHGGEPRDLGLVDYSGFFGGDFGGGGGDGGGGGS